MRQRITAAMPTRTWSPHHLFQAPGTERYTEVDGRVRDMLSCRYGGGSQGR